MDYNLEHILNCLYKKSGFDFSGYCISIIERLISHRFNIINCNDYKTYFNYLQENPDEFNNLIDELTINVSRFFRNTLTFEYIAKHILPMFLFSKESHKNNSFRVWSAGCSKGEEPYSIAILINELLEKEKKNCDARIFATDIDRKILKKAQNAIYPVESIENIKYKLLKKYFTRKGEYFFLKPVIKDMVSFSIFDLLYKKSFAPPESIFGAFDMVLCRNVLIYFSKENQEIIFEKLYRSLLRNGYLILGETEVPLTKYQQYFTKVSDCCHIYQKLQEA